MLTTGKRLARGLPVLALALLLFAASVFAQDASDLAVSPIGLAQQDGEHAEIRSALSAAIERTESFEDRFEAEVWLLDMSKRLERSVENPTRRLKFLRLVHHEASAAGLSPNLVLAVIETESHFKPWVTSRAGARGLMQVMPFWKTEIGRPEDNLLDPATNLRYGCSILKYYIHQRANGDVIEGLQRYNGNLKSTRYSAKVLNTLASRWYQI
ncbi:MAG: soluble lytic murein transglycosylase-like protein [Gammaproteobacteria bacterium]|jgi:soluble lytic murein transglycosylase-like protein